MEEKAYELIAQLHNEIKEMKSHMYTEIRDIKTNMATRDDIRRLEGELFRLENKADNKFDALFDGYKQNTEQICELRKDISNLKSIIEQHEVKLKIVK